VLNYNSKIANPTVGLKIIKKPIVNISIPVRAGGGGVCIEMVDWLLNEMKLSQRGVLPYKAIFSICSGKPQNVTNNILVNKYFQTEPIADYYFKIDADLDPDVGLISRLLSRKVDFIAGMVAIWSEGSHGVKVCAYKESNKKEFADFKKIPFGHCYFVGGGCICLSKKFMLEWKKKYSLSPILRIYFKSETWNDKIRI